MNMVKKKKKSPTLRRTFLTGLIVLTPVLVTIWVVRLVLQTVTGAVTPTIQALIRVLHIEQTWVQFIAPLIGLILSALVIYFLGTLAGNVLGRQLISGLERLLMQIPVVRGIYSATRQFLQTFSGDKTKAFSKVVLFEYPRKGLWTMGLLTGETRGEVQNETAPDVVSVFVPTTPNPTSGWLIFVPVEDVKELTMSVDDAFKMIISGGILTPEVGAKTPEPVQES
jgi:uncharacterized membrane protein